MNARNLSSPKYYDTASFDNDSTIHKTNETRARFTDSRQTVIVCIRHFESARCVPLTTFRSDLIPAELQRKQ